MGRGLGWLQRDIVARLEQAGEPVWLRDLVEQCWGSGYTQTQYAQTARAVRGLVQRGIVQTGFTDWETYTDQIRGVRNKVWLPAHLPPRHLRQELRTQQVREVMLAVLTPPLPPRAWLPDHERSWAQVFQPTVWMPYRQFTALVYQRLGALMGERPVHRGRLHRRLSRQLAHLEHHQVLRAARQHGRRIFIRLSDTLS